MTNLLSFIKAAREEPDLFRSEYMYTQEQSEEINKIIDTIELNQYTNTKEIGSSLEELMEKIFEIHGIFKVSTNKRTSTNEIDLLLEMSFFGDQANNLIEQKCLDSRIIIECKNYSDKIGVTWIGKFASLLRVSKTRMGIFISKKGITGQNSWYDSKGLIRKLALTDQNLILDFELKDFKNLEGKTLFDCIRPKRISLETDINIESFLEKHEKESDFSVNE